MLGFLPKTIVFTRHPQCEHNISNDDALRAGYSNKESPLTELGELQRDITAAYLVKEFGVFDAVYASTFLRTWEIPLTAGYGRQLRKHPSLDERAMGIWHEHTYNDVLLMYPDEKERLETTRYYDYCATGGGESCSTVLRRLSMFLRDEDHATRENLYISGHGVTGLLLRQLLTRASIYEWEDWWADHRMENASVTIYERTGSAYTCAMYNYVPWKGKIDPTKYDLSHKEA